MILGALSLTVLLAPTGGPAVSSAGDEAAAGEYVPPLVASVDPERPWPVFVAAELAVTPSGAVAEDLFDLGTVWTIQHAFERQREPSERDCIRWGEAYHFGPTTPPLDSILDLVTLSAPIVRGRVVGSRTGFSSGVPGQLLKLEVLEQLKGPGTLSYAYVFFPVAHLEVGGEAICKTDGRYAQAPELGSEVLIFTQGLRENSAEPYFSLPDNGTGVVLLGQSNDEEELPRLLREKIPGKSGKDVLTKVRSLLERSERFATPRNRGQEK